MTFPMPITPPYLDLPNINPGGGATFNGPTAASVTLSGVGISSYRSDRKVAVCLMYRDTAVIGNVSVGGINGSLVPGTGSLQNGNYTEIWIVDLGTAYTATTANIVISGTAISLLAAYAYAIYGISSTTPVAVAIAGNFNVGVLNLSLNVSLSGVAVGCAYMQGAATGQTFTWTGLTQDSALTPTGGGIFDLFSSASYGPANAASSPLSVTVTSTRTDQFVGSSASFR